MDMIIRTEHSISLVAVPSLEYFNKYACAQPEQSAILDASSMYRIN